MTKLENIRKKALQLLEKEPNGIRYSDLVNKIESEMGENRNTIAGSIWDLEKTYPELVYKPERGLFRHTKFKDTIPEAAQPTLGKIKETDFYRPFADWLVQANLEDCTKAIPMGGNKFSDKWGTPDVIGINVSSQFDIIKHETEIISAEIKIDTNQIITAFGQACAYRLFSHKVYLVIPKTCTDADIERIDSLCRIYGIGFVLFDLDPNNPNFDIRVRATKFEPDLFYTNQIAKKIPEDLFK
ncbi:MAG: hypothetical protein ACP5GS_07815 [Nitrososphaeria archaeon]